MISRLLTGVITGTFLLFTFVSSAYAGEILRDELLLLESKTPYIEKTLTLDSTQTLQVTFDWSPVPENQQDIASVTGKIIIVNGTKSFLSAEFGETNEVSLDAGEYTLLVSAKLESGEEAQLILEVESEAASLISQSLRLAEQQQDDNETFRFVEEFELTSEQSIVLSLRDNQIFSSEFIEPLQYAAILVRSLDFPPTIFENRLLEGGQESTYDLGTFPPGSYEVNLIVKGSEGAISGLSWSLVGDTEIFNQSLLLNDDSELVSRFIENISFSDNVYDIKVVGLMSEDLVNCSVELVKLDPADPQTIVFNQDDLGLTKTESLNGNYGLRVICLKGESTALGIRIAENSNGDNVVYSKAISSGDKKVIGSFELPLASSLDITLEDLRYINLITKADFIITDGADQNASFSFDGGTITQSVPELAKGIYFLVAEAETTGDALLGISVKDEASEELLFSYLYAGDNNLYQDTVSLNAGTYKFALVDHLFPTGASVFGLGIFSGSELVGQVVSFGRGDPYTDGEVELEAGDYTLAFILGQDSGESLLTAFQLEQLDSEPTDPGPEPDRGSGSNNGGSGGGGGGGSVSVLVLLGLIALGYLRRYRLKQE